MNKLTFIGCDKEYSNSDIVLFGAPFDGTVSFRPGTRFAPNIIRTDSDGIETYSPYQNEDIEDKNVTDIGDCETFFGNTQKTLDSIYIQTKEIVQDNKTPFMIGGEHLVSLPAIKAVYEEHPELRIIHFDAHTDLRDNYLGEELNHSTVIKQVSNMIGTHKIYQFGIRSGLKTEFEFAKKNHYIELFTANTVQDIIEDIKDYPIYITLDLDVLDPSIMSGTGTPEPGGLQFLDLLNALLKLKNLNIVGLDIVELSPQYDQSGVSNAVACKLIREMLLLKK
jgi:agmatinase